MSELLPIYTALISVFDKSNISEFAQSLVQKNIKLLSTGGTAQILSNAGIPILNISDYIQFPEIMNGRIKTLHHKIYSGILSRKKIDDFIINQYKIQSIDMVVVNFYPFATIIKNNKKSKQEILEYIDIGGPSMVRAAAKNYKNVVVIVNNNDYKKIIQEIERKNGAISLNTRFTLAAKALKYVAKYDRIISNYFNNQIKNDSFKQKEKNDSTNNKKPSIHIFPKTLTLMNLKFTKKQDMRYGENPHQKAALYIEQKSLPPTGSVSAAKQLQGKPLSYNNIIDMDTALECVKMFIHPTCVIVKHSNPCAVATASNIQEAYNKAYQSDPTSAFGGIIAFNYPLDKQTAQTIINQQFIEAIIVPKIQNNCCNILSSKQNIRVLTCGKWELRKKDIDCKRINGGLLIQDCDLQQTNLENLQIVTIRKPTKKEMQDALFCWKIVKFVKSNAIVCGKNYQTTGIGSGQMNRIHAAKIATSFYDKQQSQQINGSVMASDAFFPFSDGILVAAKMGISCIIQPGGSIRDKEIIATANQNNIAMIFTHKRHFRH